MAAAVKVCVPFAPFCGKFIRVHPYSSQLMFLSPLSVFVPPGGTTPRQAGLGRIGRRLTRGRARRLAHLGYFPSGLRPCLSAICVHSWFHSLRSPRPLRLKNYGIQWMFPDMKHPVIQRELVLACALLAAGTVMVPATGAVNVTEHHNHDSRDGLYVDPALHARRRGGAEARRGFQRHASAATSMPSRSTSRAARAAGR